LSAAATVPAAPGAYVLIVDLARPLALDIATLSGAVLPAGRYAYCGSAHGPGGMRARIGRHRRREKTMRWHIDRLTAAGRIVAVHAEPDGAECDLFARLRAVPGVTVPLAGFGSTDCPRCPAHLARVPDDFDIACLSLVRNPG
jgi:histidyl-tRNA synthetase